MGEPERDKAFDTGDFPATKTDVREAAKGDRLVSWLSSGLGALASVGGICVILLGGSLFVIDRSEAGGREAARQEVAPLKTVVDFMVAEQRETRIELRAITRLPAPIVSVVPELLRPMAPLPDSGK